MIEQHAVLITIAMVALIVYLTRAGGYWLGLQFRHITALKPVLEALPGCAFISILVPALRQGNAVEVLAMACVVGIMWKTDNVVWATMAGVAVLLWGPDVVAALAKGPA